MTLEGIRAIPGTRCVELGDFPSTVADMLAHPESAEERERRVASEYEWLDVHASPTTTRAVGTRGARPTGLAGGRGPELS